MSAKIFAALRGANNETMEANVDNQALRILDPELRDAGDALPQPIDAPRAILPPRAGKRGQPVRTTCR